jgi:hypothetical protein
VASRTASPLKMFRALIRRSCLQALHMIRCAERLTVFASKLKSFGQTACQFPNGVRTDRQRPHRQPCSLLMGQTTMAPAVTRKRHPDRSTIIAIRHHHPHGTTAKRLAAEIQKLRRFVSEPRFGFPHRQPSDRSTLVIDAEQFAMMWRISESQVRITAVVEYFLAHSAQLWLDFRARWGAPARGFATRRGQHQLWILRSYSEGFHKVCCQVRMRKQRWRV